MDGLTKRLNIMKLDYLKQLSAHRKRNINKIANVFWFVALTASITLLLYITSMNL